MSKKKRKKLRNSLLYAGLSSKKSINKDFNGILDEIEASKMMLYEQDKYDHKYNRKYRKNINEEERKLHDDMDAVRRRKRLAKRWEKNGFLDAVMEVFAEVVPIVRTIARLVVTLMVRFLSIKSIKTNISPKTLDKICAVYNVAMAL